jgi:hypothetical protein
MGQPALTGFFLQCLSNQLTLNLHIGRKVFHCQTSFIFCWKPHISLHRIHTDIIKLKMLLVIRIIKFIKYLIFFKFHILPTGCSTVLCMDLRTKGNHFAVQY